MSATSREGRLGRLYLAHAAESFNISRLLCPDDTEASAKANSAFVKTVASFRDLRSPLAFEASVRRSVIRECRPSLVQRIGNAGGNEDIESVGSGDPLWETFVTIPHRRKAALVLRYFERLSDDQVADVLGCSTGTARTLVNRALADLSEGGDPARTAGELVRLFARRTEGTRVPVEPDKNVLKRAARGRRAVVAGAVALAASGAVTGVVVLG